MVLTTAGRLVSYFWREHLVVMKLSPVISWDGPAVITTKMAEGITSKRYFCPVLDLINVAPAKSARSPLTTWDYAGCICCLMLLSNSRIIGSCLRFFIAWIV